MNDTGMIAPCIAFSLVNLFKPENKSQFKLRKDLSPIKTKDFLIHGNVPVTLYSNMLTFRDSKKSFKIDGDLLKTMTNYIFNVGHSNLQDQKKIPEFAEEKKFDIEKIGRKSTRDSSIKELLESLAIMASGISTIFLSFNLDEFCAKLRLLLQEKQAGNNSNLIIE